MRTQGIVQHRGEELVTVSCVCLGHDSEDGIGVFLVDDGEDTVGCEGCVLFRCRVCENDKHMMHLLCMQVHFLLVWRHGLIQGLRVEIHHWTVVVHLLRRGDRQ